MENVRNTSLMHWWIGTEGKKTLTIYSKRCPNAILPITNLVWTSLGSNQDLNKCLNLFTANVTITTGISGGFVTCLLTYILLIEGELQPNVSISLYVLLYRRHYYSLT